MAMRVRVVDAPSAAARDSSGMPPLSRSVSWCLASVSTTVLWVAFASSGWDDVVAVLDES